MTENKTWLRLLLRRLQRNFVWSLEKFSAGKLARSPLALCLTTMLSLWAINGSLKSLAGLTNPVNISQATPQVHTVKSSPDHVIWGELFKPDSVPILTVQSGDRVTLETVSHEGILADQGDTVDFLTSRGIKQEDILPDQLTVKANVEKTGPGPHVITGPIYVEDAEPGDVLEIKTVDIAYRVPYGVISNRHGKGSLPGEFPVDDADIYTKVIPD